MRRTVGTLRLSYWRNRAALTRSCAPLPHHGRLPCATQGADIIRSSFSTDFTTEGPLDEVPQSWKGIKRFYDYATICAVTEDGTQLHDPHSAEEVAFWQVIIQDRVLRTKALNELLIPNKEVAMAICGEYLMQGEYIIPATTPIYNLVCSAIDQYHVDNQATAAAATVVEEIMRRKGSSYRSQKEEDRLALAESEDNSQPSTMREDPNRPEIRYGLKSIGAISGAFGSNSTQRPVGLENLNKEEKITDQELLGTGETHRLRELLKDYLETDTACYRVALDGKDPEEALLRRRQEKYYQPLLDWFEATFGVQLNTTTGFGDLRHPTEAYEVVEDIVDAADPYLRAALASAVGCVHSTAIALAFVFGHISVEQAFEASRVEEEYQIEQYGFVEDGHDTARAYMRLQLAGISSLLWMMPESRPRAALGNLQDKLDTGKPFTEEQVQNELHARLNRVKQRRMFDRALLLVEREERRRLNENLRNHGNRKDASTLSDLEILSEELEHVQKSMNRIAENAGMKPPYAHLDSK